MTFSDGGPRPPGFLDVSSTDSRNVAQCIAVVGNIVNSAMQHSNHLFSRMSVLLGDARFGTPMRSSLEPRSLASNQTELRLLSDVLESIADATKEVAWLAKKIRIEPGGGISWK